MSSPTPFPSIHLLIAEVNRLNLLGRETISEMSINDIAAAYNGTGPEFLPAPIRKRLDSVTLPFQPGVLVHDVDFTNSDGTLASFRRANNRLLVNCVLCAIDATTWYSWRRYALILEAYLLYRACVKFGWIAWRLAYINNNKNQKEKT